MIIIYYLDLAYNCGLIRVNLGFVTDLINIPLILYTLNSYLKSKNEENHSRTLEIIWGLFILYYAVLLLMQPGFASKVSFILNLREIYPYLIFYYTIAFIKREKDFKTFWRVLMFYSVVASFLSVLQSLHPIELIMESPLYGVGHWREGQQFILGSVERVMLASLYLVEIMFLYFSIKTISEDKKKHTLMLTILALPILISYARSHWIALIFCIIMIYILSFYYLRGAKSFLKKIVLGVGIALLVYGILLEINSHIVYQIADRFMLTFDEYLNETGSYGSRLHTMMVGLILWQKNILFGLGPFFMNIENMPELTDVGFIYVLVTIGAVGLALFTIVWLTNVIFGIKLVIQGLKFQNMEIMKGGMLLITTFVFLIIIQQYTQMYFTVTLLAVISGYAVALQNYNQRLMLHEILQ